MLLLLTSSSPTMLYAPTANMDKLGIWWFANRLVFSLPHSGGRGGKPEDWCATVGRRVAALGPRVGWCRGLYLIGVYAPISTAGQASRLAVRRDVELLMALAPATHLVLILGGLNAELGNNHAGLGSCGRFCQPQGLGDWSGMEGLVLPPRSPGCL